MDYISDAKMNMALVRSELKPWTDKEGHERYYINDVGHLISEFRIATGTELRSYYDHEMMRASGGRVRQIVEDNILDKTKVFIDSEGHVHIYGYACAGKGEEMAMPELIVKAVNRAYGFCDDATREKNKDLIGKSGECSRVGDIVKIVKGRKDVGKVFEVSKVSTYYFSSYADPSVYLYADDGFKVSAGNCVIEDIGYSY